MKTKNDLPLAPSSPRLSKIRGELSTLGTHREELAGELRPLIFDIRSLGSHDRGADRIEPLHARRRELEAGIATVDERRNELRAQETEEFEKLAPPVKAVM